MRTLLFALAIATVAAPLALAGLDQVLWNFDQWDCTPNPCRLQNGAVQLCADGSTTRMIDDPLPQPDHFAREFRWNPNSVGAGGSKNLNVYFRFDQAERHLIQFRPDEDKIVLGEGLPQVERAFDFNAQEYFVFVANGDKVRVRIDDGPLWEVEIPLERQSATQFAIEVADDGTCHSFPEFEPNGNWRFTCNGGTCTLTKAEGLALCPQVGGGTVTLRSQAPIDDGITTVVWTPPDVPYPLPDRFTVFLRHDQPVGERHAVAFDSMRDIVTLSEGFRGGGAFAFQPQEYTMTINHQPVIDGVPIGKVEVRIDGADVASTTYTPTEVASAFAMEAQSPLCHAVRHANIWFV